MLAPFIADDKIDLVIGEILESMKSPSNIKNYDYDFHMDPKSLKMKFDPSMLDEPFESWEHNTVFQFDIPNDNKFSAIRSIINAMSNTEDITDEDETNLIDFLDKIRDALNGKYIDNIRSIIAQCVLKQDIKSGLTLLDPCKAIRVEISPLPDPAKGEGFPYVLSVHKERSDAVNAAVSGDLAQRIINSGKDPNEIIKERKAAEDPVYANIAGASMEKSVFEVRVEWFIDYSMNTPNEKVSNIHITNP